MIEELLHASPSLMNFANFLFTAAVLLLFVLRICYLCDFSRAEGNGIYSAP